MNTTKFESLVAEISYKPGWKLRAREDYYNAGFELVVMCKQPDRESHEPVQLASRNVIFYSTIEDMDEHAVLMWVRRCLHNMEMHEADEWINFRGERPFDPHRDERR